MNPRTYHRVIATLVKAGRTDLANHVAHGAVGYWERQYRKLKIGTEQLQRSIGFFVNQSEKLQGKASITTKSLSNAHDRLDQVLRDIKVLRQGMGKPLGPHEVPRLGRSA